jgi:hypothetical protein
LFASASQKIPRHLQQIGKPDVLRLSTHVIENLRRRSPSNGINSDTMLSNGDVAVAESQPAAADRTTPRETALPFEFDTVGT